MKRLMILGALMLVASPSFACVGITGCMDTTQRNYFNQPQVGSPQRSFGVQPRQCFAQRSPNGYVEVRCF